MSGTVRLTLCTAAAVAILAALLLAPTAPPFAATARAESTRHGAGSHAKPSSERPSSQPATANTPVPKLPQRTPFTAAEDNAATIPGMPDARFFAASTADFTKALPSQPGPWLILSTGGADGAFGAGLLNGLSAAGKRPDYAVVTGVSTGALMAPFAFAGPKYDAALKDAYTHITAADVFELGSTGESFVDSWPLKDLIAKEITPELHCRYRHRLCRRPPAVRGHHRSRCRALGGLEHGRHCRPRQRERRGGRARSVSRVLLASGSIPGAFPPVLIEVEGDGKRFAEMHVDGGVGGQFFVAPPALMVSNSGYRIPATQLYIVVNSTLRPEFQVVERSTPAILAQAVGMAVQTDLRLMLDRTFVAAKNSGIGFNVATIPASFNAPSRGPFDPEYMKALFDAGYAQGNSANAFADAPPPYPDPSGIGSNSGGKP